MACKFIILCAVLAYANAGLIAAPAVYNTYAAAQALALPAAPASISYSTPALTSQSSNIYRSFGNLGQVSTYSKTIDTPFSSVSKSDVRVSNPGVRFASAAYATPVVAHAPVVTHAPAVAHAPVLGVAYSAAPAVSHIQYLSGYTNYAF